MWLFGKRVSIKKVAQDEEEEELPEELPVFAPEIFTEKEDSAPSVPPEEPNCPSEAEELPGQETEETKDSMLFEELEVESVTPASVIEELQEDKQEGTFRRKRKKNPLPPVRRNCISRKKNCPTANGSTPFMTADCSGLALMQPGQYTFLRNSASI